MEKKMAIFDLDGTLYQTHLTSVRAVNDALTECGFESRDPEFIKSLFGESMDRFYDLLVGSAPRETKKKLAERTTSNEIRLIGEIGVLYDGVAEMLIELKEDGYELAVCSNGRKDYIDAVLESCGIGGLFRTVRGKEGGKDKTEIVAEILQGSGAGYAVMIGDRKHDYEAAAANGISSVGMSYGYGGKEIELADFIAGSAKEIPGLLRMNRVFEAADRLIEERKRSGRAIVVGINGIDASGKTTFCGLYERHLEKRGKKVVSVHLDDFHNPSAVRNKLEDPAESYAGHAFDLEKLETEILHPVSVGIDIDKHLSLLDLFTDDYTEEKRYAIDCDSVVLLEGVLLFRPPLDGYFDVRIYLDITFDEMTERILARDVPVYGGEIVGRYESRYVPAQKSYIERFDPKGRADLVIDNNRPERPSVVFDACVKDS